jgi:hypothetical protein
MNSVKNQKKMMFLGVVVVSVIAAAIFARSRSHGESILETPADQGLDPRVETKILEKMSSVRTSLEQSWEDVELERDPTKTLVVHRPQTSAPKKEVFVPPPLSVSGIIYDPVKPSAVVNGEPVHIGDVIAGAEVVSISVTRVTFGYKGKTFSVAME